MTKTKLHRPTKIKKKINRPGIIVIRKKEKCLVIAKSRRAKELIVATNKGVSIIINKLVEQSVL